jgi:hypothetical protein
MTLAEIRSHITEIEKDASLYEEKSFDARVEISDVIEFHLIGSLEELPRKASGHEELIRLIDRAKKIKSDLEGIDANLFQKLRAAIRAGRYKGKAFKILVSEYVAFDLGNDEHQEEAGYDTLDVFINGLLPLQAMPEQTKDLEPDMIFYQKTPARIVFELVEKVQFTKDDVFFDLGSGLGQVAILVNLLTGIPTKGVEFEPAFCNYARDCAADLNLSGVTFINADARQVDYSDGTVFFMYTPFKGEMLQEVLEQLRKESLFRKIKVITYGPCTEQVALQRWLECVISAGDNIYKLAVFNSL